MKSFEESVKILEKHGIRVADSRVVSSFSEVKKFARKKGFPVVLKLFPDDASVHKKKAGLVNDNVIDEESLEKGFEELSSRGVSGQLVVQERVEGVETLIGLKKDPVFGTIIVFGSGGTLANVLDDASFRVCPLKKKDVKSMVRETKVFTALKEEGVVSVVEDALLKVSKINLKSFSEMDLNPFIVNESGGLVVDVRMV